MLLVSHNFTSMISFNVSVFVVPVWSTMEDVRETELCLAGIRADLFCELAAVSLIRVYGLDRY
jgi:hypothetical protein